MASLKLCLVLEAKRIRYTYVLGEYAGLSPNMAQESRGDFELTVSHVKVL